jgi:two-component sensor histidine kinase
MSETSEASPVRQPAEPQTGAAREANHRIANHLAGLASFVRLQAFDVMKRPPPTREETRDLLGEIEARLIAVGRLHRLLAAGASANLDERLHEVCMTTVSSLSLPGRIELIEELRQDISLGPDHMAPVAQVVAEVLANAVKHAYPTGAGRVFVRSRTDGDGRLVVEVQDEGVGLPERLTADGDGGGRLGLAVVRSLAEQMDARAEFISASPGVLFRMQLPLSANPGASLPGARLNL